MTDKPTCATCPHLSAPQITYMDGDILTLRFCLISGKPTTPSSGCGDHPAFPKYLKEMESE